MSAAPAVRAETLYTPRVLALATTLAAFPIEGDWPLTGEARSPACGSSLRLGLALDPAGAVARVGVAARSCAIGQAAAAIFAGAATGRTPAEIATASVAIDHWLAAAGPLPAWPGLDAIAAAQAFPGRHGAIRLAWRAALDALSHGTAPV
jgi:NifU-like protein involved in Fe-S cluster formation